MVLVPHTACCPGKAELHPPSDARSCLGDTPLGLRDPFPVCFQPSNRVSIRTRAVAAHQCPSGSGGLRFDDPAGGEGEASLVPWLGLHVLRPRCHWLSWRLCRWIDASPASLPGHSLSASSPQMTDRGHLRGQDCGHCKPQSCPALSLHGAR